VCIFQLPEESGERRKLGITCSWPANPSQSSLSHLALAQSQAWVMAAAGPSAMNNQENVIDHMPGQALMAHACNPSNSGGRD
jgi:hypothetical protein